VAFWQSFLGWPGGGGCIFFGSPPPPAPPAPEAVGPLFEVAVGYPPAMVVVPVITPYATPPEFAAWPSTPAPEVYALAGQAAPSHGLRGFRIPYPFLVSFFGVGNDRDRVWGVCARSIPTRPGHRC